MMEMLRNIGSWLDLAWSILCIIGMFKVFEKFGEAGWKAIVPFYGTYLQGLHVWDEKNARTLVILEVLRTAAGLIAKRIGIVVVLALLFRLLFFLWRATLCIRTARCFGKSFVFGLFSIPFTPLSNVILGFGGAQYQGNV